MIEAIELGATTVMLGSALLGGYGIITETVRRLEEWLDKNGYWDIGALRARRCSICAAMRSCTNDKK